MGYLLNNITFGELLRTGNDAEMYLASFRFGGTLSIPKNRYSIKPILMFSFGRVKDAMYLLEKGLSVSEIPMFLAIFHWQSEQFWETQRVVDVFQFFSFVKAEVTSLMEVERIKLSRPIGGREAMAGVERFKDFGFFPQEKVLSRATGQPVEWVRRQPYNEMLIELCFNAVENDYNVALSQIK